MVRIANVVLIAFISSLLVYAQANSQWRIIKRLPEKPTEILNVDAPPDIVMLAPVIESATFTNDLNGWAIGGDSTLLKTVDGGTSWSVTEFMPQIYSSDIFCLNN